MCLDVSGMRNSVTECLLYREMGLLWYINVSHRVVTSVLLALRGGKNFTQCSHTPQRRDLNSQPAKFAPLVVLVTFPSLFGVHIAVRIVTDVQILVSPL